MAPGRRRWVAGGGDQGRKGVAVDTVHGGWGGGGPSLSLLLLYMVLAILGERGHTEPSPNGRVRAPKPGHHHDHLPTNANPRSTHRKAFHHSTPHTSKRKMPCEIFYMLTRRNNALQRPHPSPSPITADPPPPRPRAVEAAREARAWAPPSPMDVDPRSSVRAAACRGRKMRGQKNTQKSWGRFARIVVLKKF